jgi:ABC-type phosphate transport system substrate-binding protein
MPVSQRAELDYEKWLNDTHGIEREVQIAGGGSGVGYSKLIAGTIDIGSHSREPKSSEWNNLADMRIWAIGIDSLAIIVHNETGSYPGCSVTNMTAQQVSDVFCGVINHWDELNASLPHEPIKRAIRVLDSGTHDCFLTFFLTPFGRNDSHLAPDCLQFAENIGIYNLLSSEAGQWYIAYIGLGFLHLGHIKPTNIWNSALGEYIVPSRGSVLSGAYPPKRWLWYGTNGTSPDVEVNLWISFVRMNASYIDNEGYIQMWRSDFTSNNASPDPKAPIHPPLPDNKVDFWDLVYFADAFNTYTGTGTLNPYADFDASAEIDSADGDAFMIGYIEYWVWASGS